MVISGFDVLHVTLAITLMQIMALGHKSSCNGTDEYYDLDIQSCCKVCEAGSGIILPCTAYNTSECAPCRQGYYSAIPSHIEVCQRCRTCPINSHAVHRCNATHPTKCECNFGYFYNSNRKICEECSACKVGNGVVRPCNSYQDTLCRPCSKGTFSDVRSDVAKCRTCSQCIGGRISQQCILTKDTVCAGRAEGIMASGNYTMVDETETSWVNIGAISVCAVVILAVCLWVIISKWIVPCRRGLFSKNKGNNPHGEQVRSKAPQAIPVSSSNQHAKKSATTKAQHQRHKLPASNPELKPMLAAPIRGCEMTMLGMAQIESAINACSDPCCNWKSLAKELGYDQRKIQSFESGGSYQSKDANPVQQLLSDWFTSPQASWEILAKALCATGHHDLARSLFTHSDGQPMSPRPQPATEYEYV